MTDASAIRQTRYVAYTAATRILQFLLAGLASIIISRALQPQGRGSYYLVMTVATAAMALGGLSVDKSQIALWSRPENRHALAANSAWLGLLGGVLSALATAAVVVVLGQDAVPVSSYGLLALALTAVPFGVIALCLATVLTLQDRIDVVNKGELIAESIQYPTLILLAATGYLTVGWAVALWVLSVALRPSVYLATLRPRYRDRHIQLGRRTVGLGLRYHVGGASMFLLRRADVLMLNGLTSTVSVGLYSLAVTLAELTWSLTDATAQVALSRQMNGTHDRTVAFTLRTTRLTAILALVSVGSMCAVAPLLIPMVYGSAFSGSVIPLIALAPGLLALGATRPIGAFLLRPERPMLASALSVVALLANLGLNLILIPLHGIVGCALASSIAYGGLAAMQVAWFVRATGTPLGRLLPGRGEVRFLLAAAARSAPMRLSGRLADVGRHSIR